MKTYTLTNTSLAVRDEGQGTPILFVHGFPFDGSMWNRTFDEFARTAPNDFRLIAPDLRGLGQSELPLGEQVVPMERFADDLKELLIEMKIREKVVVCGLSMGGYVVMQFAKRYPEALAGYVLCSTKTIADPAQVADNRRILATNLVNGSQKLDSVAETMIPRLFGESTYQNRQELIQTVRTMIESNNPLGAAAAALGMAQRPDTTGWLEEIDLPLLVVCGSEDKFSPPSEMKPIAERAKQGKYVEISGAGHLPPIEEPQKFVSIIQNFTRSLS